VIVLKTHDNSPRAEQIIDLQGDRIFAQSNGG
jgi:hypothetical protein